jgi:mono/diheme cytochrome c family protein
MKPATRSGLALAFAAAVLPAGVRAADAGHGESLHRACLSCHGTSIYLPPRRKVNSLPRLKKEVERWNDMYNPKMSKRDVDDLVEYLNRDFYKFGR